MFGEQIAASGSRWPSMDARWTLQVSKVAEPPVTCAPKEAGSDRREEEGVLRNVVKALPSARVDRRHSEDPRNSAVSSLLGTHPEAAERPQRTLAEFGCT